MDEKSSWKDDVWGWLKGIFKYLVFICNIEKTVSGLDKRVSEVEKELNQKISSLEEENKYLKAEVLGLQSKIPSIESGQPTHADPLEGLTFDHRLGIHTDSSGNPFCPACHAEGKKTPLKKERYHWRCAAHQDRTFDNPDDPYYPPEHDYNPMTS